MVRFYFSLGVALLSFSCSSVPRVASTRTGAVQAWDRSQGEKQNFGKRPVSKPDDQDTESVPEQSLSDSYSPPQGESLRWPLEQIEVSSGFGKRKRDFHEGVDLRAKVGTKVFAAHSGRVLYAGTRISGYGRMVVVKSANGLATVYAHHSKILVKPGQFVKAGELIAYSGRSGRVSGPHVHFEVRRGAKILDPCSLMELESKCGRFGRKSEEIREAAASGKRRRTLSERILGLTQSEG